MDNDMVDDELREIMRKYELCILELEEQRCTVSCRYAVRLVEDIKRLKMQMHEDIITILHTREMKRNGANEE